MGAGECLAKFGLISFNVLFLLSGVGVLAVGIWVKVDKDVVNMQDLIQFDTGDEYLTDAAWVLIGFGSFVLVVSALGFLAACTQKKFFIGMYIAFLVIIFLGEFGGGITAAVYKGKIDDDLPGILGNTFNKYEPGDNLLAKAWDYIQVLLTCCGSNTFTDYKHVNWTDTSQHVPTTCCVLSNDDPESPVAVNSTACQTEACMTPETCMTPPSSKYVYKYLKTTGCYASLLDSIKSHLGLVIGVGVGIAMVQLLGIVFACCMCRREKDNLPY